MSMVKIEALIRPHRLEEVQDALNDVGVSGMTVTEVKGVGKQKGITHTYRGSQYTINMTVKLKVEVVVSAEQQDEIVKVIVDAARTGEVGDGKIFVMPITEVVRVRTGETGIAALE